MSIDSTLVFSPLFFGVIGLLIALGLYFKTKALPDGNATMNRIAGYIREGAMAFLFRQYKVLVVYCVVVAVVLGFSLGWDAAACFVLGAF